MEEEKVEDSNKTITIELNEKEVNFLLGKLSGEPYYEVCDFLNKLTETWNKSE